MSIEWARTQPQLLGWPGHLGISLPCLQPDSGAAAMSSCVRVQGDTPVVSKPVSLASPSTSRTPPQRRSRTRREHGQGGAARTPLACSSPGHAALKRAASAWDPAPPPVEGANTLFGNHSDDSLKKCHGGLSSEKHLTFHTVSLGLWTTWA